MRKHFPSLDKEDEKIVLKSIKLTEPLVKPDIQEAVIAAEETGPGRPIEKNITTKLIDKLKKIKDELFKRT
ncbi:hypothetical protein [Chryseobacterium populi]|uniref:hypothetical protein n=1 Tax=Chryseobacterium populi TaxID=1144316 RepID=UPI00030D6F1D|nr:hypothetical protein [Chryseobacterium populi]